MLSLFLRKLFRPELVFMLFISIHKMRSIPILCILFVYSCVAPNRSFEKIPPGIWRGVLLLDRKPVQKYGDDRDIEKKFDVESELPFNFEVIYENDSMFHIVLMNGEERIKVEDIIFGRDKATAKDTVLIHFPIYDTQIRAIYEDGVMEGEWIVNYKDQYSIPFKAVHGVSERFTQVDNDILVDLGGRWKSTFEIGTKDEYEAVAIFEQNQDSLSGTFLTETGDYRYLQGRIWDRKFSLSAFDGAHAFLFHGKLMDDNTITGVFRSGSQYQTNWQATRDSTFALQSAFDLTKKSTESPVNFSFENESGKLISLNDEQYKNKVKIIQIMGTWCPNCMDETVFLTDYFKKSTSKDIAWISIGFERYKDDQKNKAALKRFKSKMHLQHEVLYGGFYDKKEAGAKLPQLDKILAYPTLLVLDKNNQIVKIHTGFSGPATPMFNAFVKEFDQQIQEVLQNSHSL